MATFNSFVLFVLIWWVVLFAVLPWGVRPLDHTENPAHWGGAPERPLMWRKLLATTIISILLWTMAELAIQNGYVNFRSPGPASGSSASVTGE